MWITDFEEYAAAIAVLPDITARQLHECRHCGRALWRYAGKRTGTGAWRHVRPARCAQPEPGEAW